MVLDGLPVELLLHIFKWLKADDILSLRRTSRALNTISCERSVWYDALYNNVVSPGIPAPGLSQRPISCLTSAELEASTFRALRYRQNWVGAEPKPTKRTELHPVTCVGNMRPRLISLYFLPGRGNRWLISFTLQDQNFRPRTYVIQCWDLRTQDTVCVATMSCTSLFSSAINADPAHPAVLAITQRNQTGGENGTVMATTLGLDFDSSDPNIAFTTLTSFRSVRNCVKLHGSTFLATNDTHHIRVFDADTGHLKYVLRVPLLNDDPTLHPEEFRCLAAIVMESFVLIFRQQWIHLYPLPPFQADEAEPDCSTRYVPGILPVANHKWQWHIDTLDVIRQQSHPLMSQFGNKTNLIAASAPPMSLLLRFDSWFPWPVNILHQFILPHNPAFNASASGPAGTELPYLLSSLSSEPLRPYVVASIPSPIRIFTPSDSILGRHGTALWLDAQTDPSTPSQAGDRGQRIAGKHLGFDSYRHAAIEEPRHAVDLQVESSTNFHAYEDGSTSQIQIFHTQDEDNWGRLAVCEEEGILAVGSVDGKILIYEYA